MNKADLTKATGSLEAGKIREKELIKGYKVINLDQNQEENSYRRTCEIIDCRMYMGRSNKASVVYCLIWIRGKGVSYSGNGLAGGWGYDKQSAAVGSAIRGAGIKLKRSIDGVGEDAIREALTAIARAVGFENTYLTAFYA